MRIMSAALGGSVIGALAGLIWFLIILISPSDIPDNVDGGAGLEVVLILIAVAFMTAGGVIGCLIGTALGTIYHLARRSPRS